MAVQYRGKHERLVEQLADPLLVRLDAHDAVLRERPRACTIDTSEFDSRPCTKLTVGQKPNTLQNVFDDYRLEDVQLIFRCQ